MASKRFYVVRGRWLYELRQARFKGMNPEPPYDLCAVAATPQRLYDMTEGAGLWVGEIDWTGFAITEKRHGN